MVRKPICIGFRVLVACLSKENIRAEITNAGKEEAVDKAVEILIRSGMSTPALHETARHGVKL